MNATGKQILCPVCSTALSLRLTRGRKSGKPFPMLICPIDGRHFRGFITSQPYVAEVLSRLEGQADPRSSQGIGS